nr:GTP pyrophosphokinase family protein [Phytoactinopolyspora alkaliphila]
MDEITTKISILREEFSHLHDYNPIEHVSARLKSPESILDKIERKGTYPSFDAIRETITDIAGVRVTCSFVSDTFRIFDMLSSQQDIRVVRVKDYITKPKPNGYRSLHGVLEIPVFLSDGVIPVYVEVQIRTIAMDFWASLEHKIYYKYRKEIPPELLQDLAAAAETAAHLDDTMERLHHEVQQLDAPAEEQDRGLSTTTGPDLVPRDHVLQQLRNVRSRFTDD